MDGPQAHAFAFPLTLSAVGTVTSTVFSRAVVWAGLAQVRPESMEVVAGTKWCSTALPVGACKAITLATGNAVYLHLGVGFIQMLKAFTPAIVMAVMLFFGVRRPSCQTVLWVFVIVAGCACQCRELQEPRFACGSQRSSIDECLEGILFLLLLIRPPFTRPACYSFLRPPPQAPDPSSILTSPYRFSPSPSPP